MLKAKKHRHFSKVSYQKKIHDVYMIGCAPLILMLFITRANPATPKEGTVFPALSNSACRQFPDEILRVVSCLNRGKYCNEAAGRPYNIGWEKDELGNL